MARKPYRTARQEHLGDALDDLMARGLLRWRWEYDRARRRAIYHLALSEAPESPFETAGAEQVVLRTYGSVGAKWLPVPPPGGERQREETLRRMGAL